MSDENKETEKPKEEEKHEEKPKDEKPEGKTIEELSSKLDEIMARLSVIEQSNTEKPKEEPKPEEKTKEEDEGTTVESADEIEKLLNV